MLGQLNGGLSVGLYIPITRADDVRRFLAFSLSLFLFQLHFIVRPLERTCLTLCVVYVARVCRVCRVVSPWCSPTVAC
jgi:hypothetical protein